MQKELERPGISKVLNSIDVLGGPISFNVVAATSKFYSENPRLYAVFMKSLEEATEFINKDKRAAAKLYLEVAHDTKTTADEVFAIISDKDYAYTLKPEKVLKTAQFMAKIGSIKQSPAAIEDLFFPEIGGLKGD